MTFSDFLNILGKYYEPCIDPHYYPDSDDASGADFVRELFIASTFSRNDLFPDDESLPQKIYNGSNELSKKNISGFR